MMRYSGHRGRRRQAVTILVYGEKAEENMGKK
jgi:hypothetical protein